MSRNGNKNYKKFIFFLKKKEFTFQQVIKYKVSDSFCFTQDLFLFLTRTSTRPFRPSLIKGFVTPQQIATINNPEIDSIY